MPMEITSLIIACISAVVSIIAVWLWWKTWQSEHRPRVVAYIVPEPSGNAIETALRIHVKNVGIHCARQVELGIKQDSEFFLNGNPKFSDMGSLLLENDLENIKRGFKIPLLQPGEEKVNGFGAIGQHYSMEKGLSFEICVSYLGNGDRSFNEKILVAIPSDKDFGSSVWKSKTSTGKGQ